MSARVTIKKAEQRERRKKSIRKKVFGTGERPRLTVFRSARHIYAQIIDDEQRRTLAACSSMVKSVRDTLPNGGNVDAAKIVGAQLAEAALAAGVQQVVFDRNGFRYHGRIQALADAAREKGLKF